MQAHEILDNISNARTRATHMMISSVVKEEFEGAAHGLIYTVAEETARHNNNEKN